MKKKWTLLAGVTLSVALLSGCGAKASDNQSAGVSTAQSADGNAQTNGNNGNGQNARQMGSFGKIKSINGNTITVYKSSFQPGQGGGRGGAGQQGDGTPPSGDPGQAPPSGSADPQSGTADGQGGQGGGKGGQRGNMANMFSDETVDITVTDATKITKTEMTDNQRTETQVAIGDLKADDVITYELADGTQEAVTIKLGGFGGGMRGQGNGQGKGQGQGQGQAEGNQPQASAASANG